MYGEKIPISKLQDKSLAVSFCPHQPDNLVRWQSCVMYSRNLKCLHDNFCYVSRATMCEFSTCSESKTSAAATKCDGGSWYVDTRDDEQNLVCYKGTSYFHCYIDCVMYCLCKVEYK